MMHTISGFPLDLTSEEQAAGFRRMVLSLGGFVGPWPGESVEVAARSLSDFDALIKMSVIARTGEAKVAYRHLRYGYASWREQLHIIYRDIRFGFWRSWFRGFWPGRVDWHHIPDGSYLSPTDDCRRSLSWHGVVGVVFRDEAA